MADLTDPSADPSAPPAPAPALKPGWQSTEAWLSLLVIVLGAIPSTGLTDNAPLLAKIVGMVLAALAAINYTYQRTVLKAAALSRGGAMVTPSSKLPLATSAAAVAGIIALAIISHGCAGTSVAIKNGGDTFLQCGKQDLNQIIDDKTLLATVATDLLDDNYDQAIAVLLGKVGSDAVGCAVIAVDTILGSGKSGKAATGPRVVTPQEAHAKELISKYNWKIVAPPPAAPTAK